jgi:TorA maturation chaperone TorD
MTDDTLKASPQADLAPEEEVRAHTYRLLGVLLSRTPDEATLELLRGIDVPEEQLDSGMAAAWKTLSLAAQRATVASLEDEYHDLFIGVGRGELLPYASWYLTGYLMERPLAKLRGDLGRLGIERRAGIKEPEDHAGALCETMSLLIVNGHEISPHEQKAFFEEHLGSWMGKLFADLQQAEAANFYSAVGGVGEQFMEIEMQYLAMLPH